MAEQSKKNTVEAGTEAADFTLKDQNGAAVRLSGFRGRPVVLYFYPKDDTPGCTKEACSFRDHIQTFQYKRAAVLGISLDDAASHQKFAAKFQLNFPLLCDEDAKVSRLYGVYKKKTMFSKLFWGIERSTFVIAPDGKIAKIFRKVKVDGHTNEVLEALKSL